MKPEPSQHNKSRLFIVFTVMLDSMGIGLIMPVMPDLIREIHSADLANAAFWGGWLGFTYALMQFLCGPLIGNLSDRFGRRPVLVLSLFCMGLDYFLMALAANLYLLFFARFVSGITGATYATAAAYLSDISSKGERAKNFGLIGAAFGIGFILGPALGGVFGEMGARVPFVVAGALAFANACFGFFILPETLPLESRRTFEWNRCNPFSALLRARRLPNIGPILWVVLMFSIANQVYPSVWSFFTMERFAWTAGVVGASLAFYGLCSAGVQIFALPKLVKVFGEIKTALIGLSIAAGSMLFLSTTQTAWLVFATMPVVAFSGIVGPALQSVLADQVSDSEQGELQGVFASIVAFSMIISPVLMSQTFALFTGSDRPFYAPGAPFAVGAFLTIVALLLLLRNQRG